MENAKLEYKACCEAILKLYEIHREEINALNKPEDRLEQCKAILKKNSQTKGLINYILSADAGFDTEVKLELLESYLIVNHR